MFKNSDINKSLFFILILQFITRITALLLLPHGAVSYDAYSWLRVSNLLKMGINPYAGSPFLNWPPLWMQIIYALSKVSILLNMPFLLLLKSFLIFWELILTIGLYFGLKLIYDKKPEKILIWAIVLNPIVILLNIQHLNFDVLVALWETCFVVSLFYFVDKKQAIYWLYACLFLGLGVLTKGIPLILLPLVFIEFQRLDMKERILGFLLIFAPSVLGLSILYCLNSSAITEDVFKYRSVPGEFGISGLIINFWGISFSSFQRLATFLVVFFPLAFSCFVFLKQHFSKHQISVMGVILISFHIILAPGYGTQYIYWIIPFIIFLFPYMTSREKLYIKTFYFITVCTYFVEYALIPPYGAFLFKTDSLRYVSWSHKELTLLNLPLFIIYCLILIFSIKSFLSSLMIEKHV